MSSPVFTCFVPGIPRPGGSKTATVIRRKGGEPVMANGRALVTTRDAGGVKTANWRADVAHTVRRELAGCGALFARGVPFFLRIRFVMPRLGSHFNSRGQVKPTAPKYHTVKPDATKLLRSTEDACTGILWHDDAACMPCVWKEYGDEPGAHIEVYAASDAPVAQELVAAERGGLFG